MRELVNIGKGLAGDRIAFFGPMAAGKSYCAQYLVDNYGFEKINFAGALKELAKEWFGVTGKDGEDRIVLQQLGQKMREIDNDIWIKLAFDKMAYRLFTESKGADRFVVDDLRYVNEADALKDHGFLLVAVQTKDDVRFERINKLYPNNPAESLGHSSEIDWMRITPDYIVYGNDFNVKRQIENLLAENFGTFLERELYSGTY